MQLPAATAGLSNQTLSYAFTGPGGALPAGLSFDASTRQLTGVPTTASDGTAYTLTVSEPVSLEIKGDYTNHPNGSWVSFTRNLDVNITVSPVPPDQVASPTLRGEGRGRLHLQWDRPTGAGAVSVTGNKRHGNWEWTADDPSSAGAVWEALEHIEEEDTDDDGADDRMYGQAVRLVTGVRYDLWIRACTGTAPNRVCSDPSASSAGGTPRDNPANIDGPDAITLTAPERGIVPIGDRFTPDPDLDGDDITWSLLAVTPDDQDYLDDVFDISGNGQIVFTATEYLDYEYFENRGLEPEWVFDVRATDSYDQSTDTVRVTVVVEDLHDEPPGDWSGSSPFWVDSTGNGFIKIKSAQWPDAKDRPAVLVTYYAGPWNSNTPWDEYEPWTTGWAPEWYEARYCETAAHACADNDPDDSADWAVITRKGEEVHRYGNPEISILNLKQDTEHKIQVRACNHEGCNAWSDGVTGTSGSELRFDGSIGSQIFTVGADVGTPLQAARLGGTPPHRYILFPPPWPEDVGFPHESRGLDLPSGLDFGPWRGSDQPWDLNGTPNTSQPWTEYTYQIAGRFEEIVEQTFTIRVNPAKPTGLTAHPGDGKIILRWDDPGDAGITDWLVSVTGGAWRVLPHAKHQANGNSVLVGEVTGLTNGTQYGFTIRARSGAGSGTALSEVSDPVLGTPERDPFFTLGAPSITPVSSNSLSVSWDQQGDSGTIPFDTGVWGTGGPGVAGYGIASVQRELTTYDVRYREGESGEWTEVSGGSGASVIIGGLEPDTGYQAQVRVSGSGGWSETGTGRTEAEEAGPAITDVSVSYPATATVGDTVVVTASVTGEVADGGKPYRWVRTSNGNSWFSSGPSRTFRGWPPSPGARSWELFVTGSDGEEYSSGVFTITWHAQPPPAAENRAPAFAEGGSATRSAAENAAGGTDIGGAVSASDADGDSLTYSLGGTDAASFTMDAATGQLRVRDPLDYESRASYSVTVTATDPSGASDSIEVSVNVTDADEPPGKPAAPAVSAESSTSLNVTWSAPANTGPVISGYGVRYREGSSGAWTDAGHSGTAASAAITSLKAGTAYQVQVRASNAEGTGPWSDSGAGSTAADDGPAITEVSVSHPATATLGDTVVVTASVTGEVADGGKPYRWVRTSNGNSWYSEGPSRTFQGWPTTPATRSWELFVTGSDGKEYSSGVFSIEWVE